eukprot:gene57248-biopygen118934
MQRAATDSSPDQSRRPQQHTGCCPASPCSKRPCPRSDQQPRLPRVAQWEPRIGDTAIIKGLTKQADLNDARVSIHDHVPAVDRWIVQILALPATQPCRSSVGCCHSGDPVRVPDSDRVVGYRPPDARSRCSECGLDGCHIVAVQTCAGQTAAVSVGMHWTVGTLKQHLCNELGIPIAQQRLQLAGAEMDESRDGCCTLWAHGLRCGSVLILNESLNGGGRRRGGQRARVRTDAAGWSIAEMQAAIRNSLRGDKPLLQYNLSLYCDTLQLIVTECGMDIHDVPGDGT